MTPFHFVVVDPVKFLTPGYLVFSNGVSNTQFSQHAVWFHH